MNTGRGGRAGYAALMLLAIALMSSCLLAEAPKDGATSRPERASTQNYFGAHLLAQSAAGRDLEQLRWARYLVGRWGYAKTLLNPIDMETRGPSAGWVDYVRTCYEMEMIPVLRLGGHYRHGRWEKPRSDAPGDYHSMAAAVRRVVEGLPRSDACPLYVEVWNEPNLPEEWSGKAEPREYAAFFAQVARAIRQIGDSRIRILNGALATNPEFLRELCEASPDFARSFDLYAAHPYPWNLPPRINHHNKVASATERLTIDAYLLELSVLEHFGKVQPQVMITETGYELGNKLNRTFPIIDEANRADYMMRAFRDHYRNWKEITAVIPFIFASSNWERFNWVYPESATNPDGSPTRAHAQYWAVAALARPNDETGAISGTLKPEGVETRMAGVTVQLDKGESKTTDAMGNFFFARIAPGEHRVAFSKGGFVEQTREINVVAGSNSVADARLLAREQAALTGIVRDGATSKPMAGAHVRLIPHIRLESYTDASGRFTLNGLVPTPFRLVANAPGFCRYESETIDLRPGETTQHDFRLGAQVPPASSGNLLINPSFEEGGGAAGRPGLSLGFEVVAGSAGFDLDRKRAHTGRCSQAIRLSSGETIIRQVSFYSTIQAGSRYLGGGWVLLESKAGRAWITASFMTQSGEIIKTLTPPVIPRGRTNTWQWIGLDDVAPPSSQRMSLEMRVEGKDGTAYFDDVHLGLIPLATSTSP